MSDRLRGAAFYALFYPCMALFGLVGALPAALSIRAARAVSKGFFRTAFALLRVIGGVRIEIRGAVPTGRALIASKHQSMLDVMILFAHLPEAYFVMKLELLRTPIFGWYAKRVGAVAIDRSAGPEARRAMIDAMASPERGGGQIVIYPQGTRVAPGRSAPYRAGVHGLYEATGLPCVPAATNAGMAQPKGLAIRPRTVVMEFLEPIPPGLARAPFMETLERRIETAVDALDAEPQAGSARPI
jgi:1-acyl-sn-glycerol-3-phosphate acyltransferase